MSQQLPDPGRWLADLMNAEQTVLWPAGDAFGTSKALAAAATSWTRAVADYTAWQLSTLQQMASLWTAAMPGVRTRAFDALARIYLAQDRAGAQGTGARASG